MDPENNPPKSNDIAPETDEESLSPEAIEALLAQSDSADASERNPEEATADQLDVLKGMLGNFSPEPPEEQTPEQEAEPANSTVDTTADQLDALQGMMGGFGSDANAEEEEENDEDEAPAPEEGNAAEVDALKDLMGSFAPEQSGTEEPQEPQGPALTEDILHTLLTTFPDKSSQKGDAAVSPPTPATPQSTPPREESVDEDAIASILDVQVDAIEDTEQLSPEEIAKLMEAESEQLPADPPPPPPVDDDLAEEELLPEDTPPVKSSPTVATEPALSTAAAEQPEPASSVQKRSSTSKSPMRPSRRGGLIGIAAVLAAILAVRTITDISGSAPTQVTPPELDSGIPIIGSRQSLPSSAIEPLLATALGPLEERFDVHTGWIHAVAHSEKELTATVAVTAVLREPLYALVDNEVLHSELVLPPSMLRSIHQELAAAHVAELPTPHPPLTARLATERYPKGFPVRFVLTYQAVRKEGQWRFDAPQRTFSDEETNFPRGFTASQLGRIAGPDSEEAKNWILAYNQTALSILELHKSKSLDRSMQALQQRLNAHLGLFEPFEELRGTLTQADNTQQPIPFSMVITETHNDGFFEGYFRSETQENPKHFSGRVDVEATPSGNLSLKVIIRTLRTSGATGVEDTSPFFRRGFSSVITLERESDHLVGRSEFGHITIEKP